MQQQENPHKLIAEVMQDWYSNVRERNNKENSKTSKEAENPKNNDSSSD